MVKPSKSMQPEHVDLQQAAKRIGKGAAFGEDSFRNYMALKIATQRQQFGLVLPPPPPALPSNVKGKPSLSMLKPPPQKQEAFEESFDTNQEPTSSNFPTATTQQPQAGTADRTLAHIMNGNPPSGRVAPSANQTSNHEESTSTTYERPTLLERSSLAPLSQMAYSTTGDHLARGNRTTIDDSGKHANPSDRSVRFAEDTTPAKWERKKEKTKMQSMINRLKKRHGRGNHKLERKNGKRRKSEGLNKRIEKDQDSTVSMDSQLDPPEKEDGLSELDRLFAITDWNDSKLRSNDDAITKDAETCGGQRIQSITMKMKPAPSTIAEEEGKSTTMVKDSLSELDRMFEMAETANTGDSHSSFHHHESGDANQENPREQQEGLTELDGILTKIGAANNDDSRVTCGDKSSGQKKLDVPEQQYHGLTELDRIFSTTGTTGELEETAPLFDVERDKSGESNRSVAEEYHAVDAVVAVASDSSAIDNEPGECLTATTTMASSATPSPKTIRRLRPDLFFYGVVVKIAGYTNPDNETIRRLLQKHGGDLEAYETERVTHIIAQQLSTAKANVYKKARRPRPVCRPSWIVDSVREGKLLPHGKYLLIEERDQQQMGIQNMFQKHADDKNRPSKASLTPSSPQKSLMIQNNPYAKRRKSEQSPEKQSRNGASVDENAQISPTKHNPGRNRGNAENPFNSDKKFINGKVRTVGTDPSFLDSYFASSRLSFIGSFKQRASSTHNFNGNGSSPLLSNSKKLIFHVDMDCFFASVVLRNFPQYQDKPVVISHHGNRSNNRRKDDERGSNHDPSIGHVPKNSSSECATCNYEARKYGIKKGMFLGRAKELCPELIVLMYDFEGYEEVSQQVSDILYRLAASENHRGVLETVSCDEAYVELNFDSSEESEKLYDHAYQVAESVRNEIFDTTQCTASIGVGANKFLAKLGTDKAKPNKSFCVRDYRELLRGLKLRDVHGVGWRTESKLVEEGLVTVQDVWDLGSRGETELIRILGPGTGKKIFLFTQGKDDRPITPVERKTIGAECNYGVRFDGPYGIDHFMEGLAKEVEKRMEGISMKGKKLTLKIKQRKKGASNKHKFLGHGSCHNLSKSTCIPGNTATRDSELFKKIGLSLFREFAIADIHEIRGMGITISSLENDNSTGKQTNSSGMQSWLHQSNEMPKVNAIGSNAKTLASKDLLDGETEEKNNVLPRTPEPCNNLEKRAVEIVVDEGNEPSSLMIELPPMSQIQMSQVGALPPELQQQIRRRINTAHASKLEENNFNKRIDSGMVEERFRVETPKQSKRKRSNEVEKDGGGGVLKSVESPLLIELPPMSQIRMTQVEALPNELKEQIYSRMNRTTTSCIDEEIVDVTDETMPVNQSYAKQHPVESEQQHRFRQTDLKRMMRLAAVRSGHESTSISLTQLEQLPLEIKLQVVNCDDRQIGVLSQHPSRPASSSNRPPAKDASKTAKGMTDMGSKVTTSVSNQAKNKTERKKTADSNIMVQPTTTAVGEKRVLRKPRREFRIIDRVDVWKEDLLPLKEFLNDNCPSSYPNSINMVLDFLSIVLKEGRLPDMVTMIRCIRNRQDEWSKIGIIERIAKTMNDLHIELYGTNLDVGWLMGIEE